MMLDLVTQVGERRARGRRHRPLHASGSCFESSLDFLSKVQPEVGAGHRNTQLNLLVGFARHLTGDEILHRAGLLTALAAVANADAAAVGRALADALAWMGLRHLPKRPTLEALPG